MQLTPAEDMDEELLAEAIRRRKLPGRAQSTVQEALRHTHAAAPEMVEDGAMSYRVELDIPQGKGRGVVACKGFQQGQRG